MGVYNTIADTRKNQFQKQQLDHTHHFRGKLDTRASTQTLFLEGRDSDFYDEADALFLPDQSILQFQLSYVMVDSNGNPIDAETSVHLAEKTGSGNISLNNDANYPNVIVEHSAGTASEAVDPQVDSSGDAITLSAEQDQADLVFVHAQIELLAWISTDLSYLDFQSN